MFLDLPMLGRCMAEAGFPPQNEAAYFQVSDEAS